MSEDHASSAAYDAVLDSLLRGQAGNLDEVLASAGNLTPEQQKELRALATAFRRRKPEASGEDQAPPFREVGGFRLLRRLGGGGAGVVWLARQAGLDRSVALKILRPGLAFSGEAAARFEREGKTLARLRHPGIVAVIASGAEHGLPWIAMEYVAGLGLDEIVAAEDGDAARPSITQIVSWCRDVARALACAHEAGVVHRDVKPSNIRIGPDGRAVLVDFGLSWEAGGETLTQTGWFRGSPRYASPEQISKRSGSVDGRTDVYSLGVTLYEAVTRRPPFEGETTEQLFKSILEGDAAPPRRIRPDIPRELETVILTAMEREPKRRYATARQLADDLDALLELRDVLARTPGPLRRFHKAARRHPFVAMAAAAALLIAAAVQVHRIAQAAADRDEALSSARGQLVKYRDVRDRAASLELAAADLREQVALRPLTSAELERQGRGDGEARSARTEAEALFQSAFDRASGVLARDSDAADARDLLADLCMERWRESLRANDTRMQGHWSGRVRAFDHGGRYAEELAGLGRVRIAVTPAGASAWVFRYQEESEVVPSGGQRLVPVPAGGLPPSVTPGRWCLRALRGAGEVEADDLVLDVLGHPIEGTCFVDACAPPARSRDVLVSIDGAPTSGAADLVIASRQGRSEPRTFTFEREGTRFDVVKSLDELRIAVARADLVASDGGMKGRVWREGRIVEMELPSGAQYRITAAPLFKTESARVSPGTPRALEPGSWVALIAAPGYESQRVPFVVPRGGEVEIEARLDQDGTTPPGFVSVPAGDVDLPAALRKDAGTGERSTCRVDAFAILEREVLTVEFLRFLNDPETPQALRDRIAARATPHGDRPSTVWSRFRRKPDGFLEAVQADGLTPIRGVSFTEARGYAQWRTSKERKAGRDVTFDLPTDLELLRAARGVDGRPYSYGWWFSPAWQKAAGSHPVAFPEPPLSFPVDESPFGVFDLTGSVAEWCIASGPAGGGAFGQGLLGGSFADMVIPPVTRVMTFKEDATDPSFGFRIVIRRAAAESR